MIILKLCVLIMLIASIAGFVIGVKEGNNLADKTLGAIFLTIVFLGLSLIPVSVLVLGEMAVRTILG